MVYPGPFKATQFQLGTSLLIARKGTLKCYYYVVAVEALIKCNSPSECEPSNTPRVAQAFQEGIFTKSNKDFFEIKGVASYNRVSRWAAYLGPESMRKSLKGLSFFFNSALRPSVDFAHTAVMQAFSTLVTSLVWFSNEYGCHRPSGRDLFVSLPLFFSS